MSAGVLLRPLGRDGIAEAQRVVTEFHYLRRPVDPRCMVEGYSIHLRSHPMALGYFLLGRPEATRCGGWYGSLEDVATGWAPCTRWEILNLARVWLAPGVQPGGVLHSAEHLPGFTDRRGVFRSTFASAAVTELLQVVGRGYLVRRPPCFLEEPYELRWLLSYCDTRIHRGTLYRAAGAELYRTNGDGIQTWRWPLAPLTPEEDAEVRRAAAVHPRSINQRARRAQCVLRLEEAVS